MIYEFIVKKYEYPMNNIELLKAIKQTGATAEEVAGLISAFEDCDFCKFKDRDVCDGADCEQSRTEFIENLWKEENK